MIRTVCYLRRVPNAQLSVGHCRLAAPKETPLAICTSSGTVGHSFSYGKADAVVAVSRSASLADAAATAICNIIQTPEDIKSGTDFAKNIQGLLGTVIIKDDKIGIWGNIEISLLGKQQI